MMWQISRPILFQTDDANHLDLGSGNHIHNPFNVKNVFSLDLFETSPISDLQTNYIQGDLTRTLPFENNTFDSISAYDVLEHIPRWERHSDDSIHFPFIELMSEIYRILKPGGYFYALTPSFPKSSAFQDPTHVNLISVDTLSYFTSPQPYAKNYGFVGEFKKIVQIWVRGVGPTTTKTLSPGINNKNEIIDIFKIIVRSFRVLKNRNSTHLLWVLQK